MRPNLLSDDLTRAYRKAGKAGKQAFIVGSTVGVAVGILVGYVMRAYSW